MAWAQLAQDMGPVQACPLERALSIPDSNPLDQHRTHKGPQRAERSPGDTSNQEYRCGGTKGQNASTESNVEGPLKIPC